MPSLMKIRGSASRKVGYKRFSRWYGLFNKETNERSGNARYRHAEALKYWEFELKAGALALVDGIIKRCEFVLKPVDFESNREEVTA